MRRARAAIDAYLRRSRRVGDAPLFPSVSDPRVSIHKTSARRSLLAAEKRAGLPKLERGAWHPHRPLWAPERRHLVDVDVARAGGWRTLSVMTQSYQLADAEGVLKVIENTPVGLTLDSPQTQVADGTTR